MKPLTGVWKLKRELSSPQQNVMRAMGRPNWQADVVDQADEDFFMLHFAVRPAGLPESAPPLHLVDKRVTIELQQQFLQLVKGLADFTKLHYEHKLSANGKEVKHPDDEKGFGPCVSVCSVGPGEGSRCPKGQDVFLIRWYLRRGLLKVFHFVDENDRLHAVLQFHPAAAGGVVVSASKVYERVAPGRTHLETRDRHPLAAQLLGRLEK